MLKFNTLLCGDAWKMTSYKCQNFICTQTLFFYDHIVMQSFQDRIIYVKVIEILEYKLNLAAEDIQPQENF